MILGIILTLTYKPELSILSFKDLIQPQSYIHRNPVYFSIYLVMIIYQLSLLSLTILRIAGSLKLKLLQRERKTVIMILTGLIPLSLILLFSNFVFLPLRRGVYFYLAHSGIYTVYFLLLIFQFGYIDRKAVFRFFIIYPSFLGFITILYNKALVPLNSLIINSLFIHESFLIILELLLIFNFSISLIRILENRIDSLMNPSLTNIHKILSLALPKLAEIIDIIELDQFLIKLFTHDLDVKKFYFLMRDTNMKTYHSLHQCDIEFFFPLNGELANKLYNIHKLCDIQKISLSWEQGEELELLDKYKISFTVPLFTKNKLDAVCLMGGPGVARPWHQREIEELEIFFSGIPVIIGRCQAHTSAIELEQKQAKIERITVLNAIASEVAHEIRNPLSIISTSAETIVSKNLSGKEIRHLAVDILEETERMSKLLNRLLTLPPLGQIEHSQTDIKETIKRAFELISRKALKNHIHLELSFTNSNCTAMINKEAFIQVCLNISLNAIEVLPENGIFKAVIKRNQDNIEVQFIDNGPGISPEIEYKIFEPFFTTKQTGTGLGLAVSKRIITEAGGTINVESTVEKTVFNIILPQSDF